MWNIKHAVYRHKETGIGRRVMINKLSGENQYRENEKGGKKTDEYEKYWKTDAKSARQSMHAFYIVHVGLTITITTTRPSIHHLYIENNKTTTAIEKPEISTQKKTKKRTIKQLQRQQNTCTSLYDTKTSRRNRQQIGTVEFGFYYVLAKSFSRTV